MQVWYKIMEGSILTRLREPSSKVPELIEYKIMLCWSELIMISINMYRKLQMWRNKIFQLLHLCNTIYFILSFCHVGFVFLKVMWNIDVIIELN